MSPRIVLTLALLGNAVPLQAQVQQTTIRLDHLTVEDGLSDGGVNALVQDEHGFLWIGTGDGLNRYDGYGFTVFRHDPADPHSLYDTTIYGLALASGGGLWIATFSGIEHYDPVTGAFTRYADDSGAPDRLPYDEYYEVLEDQHGDVWAGSSRHGVFRLDPATGAVTAFPADPDDPSALLHESVVEIVETRDGTLWVATGRNGLHRFDPATDAFVRVPVAEPGLAASDGFFHIEEDPDGALWLGGWGLTRLDPATGETVRFLPAPDLPEPDPPRYDNYVSSLVWDRQGRLWVGTFHKGLYRFDPATEAFTHFPPDPGDPTSLLEDTINRMLLDRSGVLWVGMDEEGLSRLDPRREHVIRLSAPEHEGLDEVREDHEGALWLVFEQTLVRWDPATGQSTVYRHGRGSGGLTDSRIFSLHTVPSMPETIWIGDRDGILHRMDAPGRIAARYALVPDPDWEGNPVFEVVEDSTQPGVLWVAVWNLGLCRLDVASGTHRCIEKSEGGLVDFPRDLAEDRLSPGVLWIGGDSGLQRFDTATQTFTHHYRHDPADPASLSIDFVDEVYPSQAEPGILWVGTWAGGLNRFDTRTGRVTHRYTEQNSDLPRNNVVDVIEDDDGVLWLGLTQGAARFDPRTGAIQDYTAALGLPLVGAGGFLSSSGDIVLGVNRDAVYRFDPGAIALNTHAPEVVLTGLRLRDETVRPGPASPLQRPLAYTEALALPYAQRDVAFDYVALDYVHPEGIRYAYRLEGYDDDWHEVEDQRRATYTNLPPGRYTFRVRAANADGVWNEEGAAVQLTIRPPWWRSVWAYLSYGLLLLGGALAVDRLQRRRVIARERERARERELEQAREIERAYHELRDAQAQLVQQEKMASLGQLTAGIAHEIKNPLNFVNNFAALSKELVDELEEETDPTERAALLADLKANAAKIEEHGQRADAIVRAMLEHSRGGAGERQTVKLNALVDDYVNLAYHGMRARRVDFEVALTQDLAEDVGHVEVVPQDIGRVLVNLLNNAFDAVYERAMRQDGPYVPAVKVSTRRENGQAEVRVEDNGTGIPVEVREKIFEPFFTTKPTGEGTGLGLSMSYDIVTQGHKGTLVVENGAREGVTFVVALPAEGGAAGPSPDRRA